MTLNFRLKVLAGAVALALGGGTAMANTNLDAATVGDVFINVVDSTNNTSFLFDTGVSQASFNTSINHTYTFSSDVNYTAFKNGEGTNDVIDYSVLSATRTTATPNVGTVFFTSNQTVTPVVGANIAATITGISAFFTSANGVTSTTANSALLGPVATWGQVQYEQSVDSNLGIIFTSVPSGVNALAGQTLAFYDESSNALRSGSTNATLTTVAGTWNYVAGVATYTATAHAVPLPTPVLLLLSGLALMGVVARRGKGTVAGPVAA